MPSLNGKQMLNSWATHNKIFPLDWKKLATAILEAIPQLQWKNMVEKEARTIE